MKLRFLPSHEFRTLRGPQGTLHIRGRADLSDAAILASLCEGVFPTSVRGNFAFVFEGLTETIAAVDHVATYPLFYTDEVIGSIFVDVQDTLDHNVLDEATITALDVFGGHNFTTDTVNPEIKRLRNGHYLRSGRQHLFIDLTLFEVDPKFSVDEFREVVESVFKAGLREKNALLLSAGTDSVTLAGITRSIGVTDRFDYLHIYSSHQVLTEHQHCQDVAAEMGLDVTYFDINVHDASILPTLHRRVMTNWRDNGVVAKHRGMVESGFGDRRLLTGECGDQLFGGPKNDILLKYCAQVENPSPEIIANIWINNSTRNQGQNGLVLTPKAARWRQGRIGGEEAYRSAVEHVGGLFTRLSHLPYLARFMRINLMLKGPYRAYAYSQDTLDWWSPFTEWEIVKRAMTIPPEVIMPGGLSKGILYNTWKEWVSDRPWTTSKIGIGLPGKERYRADP